MPRFFVNADDISGQTVCISGEDVKHISKVLRLRTNEEITVCDKNGNDYECRIEEISADAVVASIISVIPNKAESDIKITLYQGMPKSDKMDYIIQKCVELGVCRIVPVITKRAISRPSDGDKKITRWQKISAEAAKQCGRGIIPEVSSMLSFKEAVGEAVKNDTLLIVPYECESENSLKEVLQNSDKKEISVFIGPEGGFDESEVILAQKNEAKTVTLGPRILRTETAPIAVCSAIMYELGDW